MPTKTKIKEDMEFNITMTKLLEALKGIAAAQFQTLKNKKKEKFEKFDRNFANFFRLINLTRIGHPALKSVNDKTGVIAVMSELGFMGTLNSKIGNMSLEIMGNSDGEFIVTGKKGAAKLKVSGKKVTIFPGIRENKRYEQAVAIKDYVVKLFDEQKIGKLDLVYANPISFTSQKVESFTLLPATELFRDKEKYVLYDKQELCIESDVASIMKYLVEIWITTKLYETFFDSKLSEYAAQSVQLEGSLQYLEEEGKRLRLKYNKARQEEVDSAMREVFSAILGASGGKK
ncbi:MAG: F0F1 ATP synthase subunit gamma [Candidatus Omnitrophica bacterium]|nr:F0F1 ATP synthase subunit gamma [Candidatus Omnitrophota bacterium]